MTLSLALAVVAPSTAHAEGDAGSRALAVQLFDEAEQLFGAGKFPEACPKYAESYRLDPQLGALMHMAECYEKNKQVASAWGTFREAEEMARTRNDQRADLAGERARALESLLSYLVVEVPPSSRLPGLEVLRDGAPVAVVLWGGRAAIDAGHHRLEARAPGHKPWRQDVLVPDAANTVAVSVPKLEAELLPAASGSPRPVVASHDGEGSSAHPAPGKASRVVALGLGALGVVGVGLGGVFAVGAQSLLGDSKKQCNERSYCTADGAELRQQAKSKALVATISTSVGVGALVAAGVLWFTAPKMESASAERARSRKWGIGPTATGYGLELDHVF